MYSDRLCAFIDILGFRQLVAKTGTDDRNAEALQDILRRVHSAKVSDAPKLNDLADYRTQSISDAVAISARPTPAGLILILRALEPLPGTDLLALGYFVRRDRKGASVP